MTNRLNAINFKIWFEFSGLQNERVFYQNRQEFNIYRENQKTKTLL